MNEDEFIETLDYCLNPPSYNLQDNVVNKPDKLFRYHGGYRIGKGQKPRRVNPPQVKHTLIFRSAHP